MHSVAKVKIAVSLAPEVIELLDRHADGRSRSRAVEEELLRALRAREWERLAGQMTPDEAAEQLAWAETSFTVAAGTLAREERTARPRSRPSSPPSCT
jgi:hypothetical protein